MRSKVKRLVLHVAPLFAIAALAVAVATPVAWTARHGTAGASIRLCTVPLVGTIRGGSNDCIDRVAEAEIGEDALDGLAMLASFERDHPDPRFRARCHILMHGVSRKHATLRDLRRIDEVDGLSSCVDGFVHGGIDAVLGEDEVDASEVIKLAATRLCPDDPLWRTRSCQHGFGHSLMRRSDNDMRESLADCEQLGDAGFDAACAGGAMMEYTFALEGLDDAAHAEPVGDAAEARDRCDTLVSREHRWHGACVGWLTISLGETPELAMCRTGQPSASDCRTLIGYNLAQQGEPMAACDRDGDCLRGYATMAMSADRSDHTALARTCRDISGTARTGCLEGGGIAIRLGMGERNTASARKLCSRSVDAPADRAACIAGVEAGDTASWMM